MYRAAGWLVLALLSACSLDLSGLAGPDGPPPVDSGLPIVSDSDASSMDGAVADAAAADTGTSDSGEQPADFYDLDWAAPVELLATADSARCETDPVVTSDLRWLYVSRQDDSADGCYSDRRFHVFEWNDGSPTYVEMLPRFDALYDESNAHPVDGAASGRPASVSFLYQANASGGIQDILWVELRGATRSTPAGGPSLVMSGAGGPTLTMDGRRMVVARALDFLEVTGSAPDSWGSATARTELTSGDRQGDAALSADGRVIVYFRTETGLEPDLWVARRRDASGPFEAPTRLAAPINSPEAEMDSFLTARGDLLFVSARGDGTTRRIFLARRVVP